MEYIHLIHGGASDLRGPCWGICYIPGAPEPLKGTPGARPWTEADLTDSGKLLREILKNRKTACP
jgi:hypothetical protein